MSQNPLISIIVLNYNAGNLLINCIKSIFNSTYKNIQVIVVDNVSIDNSHKQCKKQFPEIILIENKKNYGYCEGNNIGIRKASGEFILILNPDTEIHPSCINELLKIYFQNGEGLYQPKILSLYNKNELQSTGNMMQLFGFGFAKDKGNLDKNNNTKIEKINYASGTCLFTSKKVLNNIGLLDQFLFLYHDDLDLGWRGMHLGIDSYYVPTAVIYHAESYALKWSAKKFFWLERNRKYCIQTHFSKHTYKKLKVYFTLVDIFVWIFYISKGFLFTKIKAELDILKNKQTIEKKYNELETKKKISDIELIANFSDKLFVPTNVSGNITSKWFNSILEHLSKKAKKSILTKK